MHELNHLTIPLFSFDHRRAGLKWEPFVPKFLILVMGSSRACLA